MRPSLVPSGNAQEIRWCTVAVERVVQGVGFRPFVYRMAESCGLVGSVWNDGRGVRIEPGGASRAIEGVLRRLVAEAPPAASATKLVLAWGKSSGDATAFRIDTSRREGRPALFPAPDLATCPACVSELADAGDRRHLYAFVNCTACGPRFTIIRELPYDRELTSMAAFAMCGACCAEYCVPHDRRFHAEPTARPDCGPRVAFESASERSAARQWRRREPRSGPSRSWRSRGLAAITLPAMRPARRPFPSSAAARGATRSRSR